MSKRFGAIILPLQIVKHNQFAKKIQQTDLMISNNVQYLKKYIQVNHQICQHHTKQIMKYINSAQKKLKTQNKEETYFAQFLNNLLDINQCIENQVSKNLIYMNSKKYQGMKRVNQMINVKLRKAGQSVRQFVQMVREYNSIGQIYIKKTQYFENIQKNPIKYYSFTKNKEKYQKIRKIQEQLQRKREAISILKSQIKVMTVELSVKISEFYQNIRLRVEQFRKVVQIILYKVLELIRGVNRFSKIDEASQRAEQSQLQITPLSRRKASDGNLSVPQFKSTKQYIKQLKKQKAAEFERQADFQGYLMNFLTFYQQSLNSAQMEMQQVENQKPHKNFIAQKQKRVQFLPPRCTQDIDIIMDQFKIIKSIMAGTEQIIPKQVFQQIFKRQRLYYNRFIQEVEQIQEILSRNNQEGSILLLKDAQEKQRKFNQEENQWKKELQIKFKDIINRIRHQFIRKGDGNNLLAKADKKIQLFTQINFEVLKINYFETNKPIQPFLKSQYLIRYQEVIKSDKIKKIVLDIQTDPTKPDDPGQEKRTDQKRSKTSCCGIFRKVDKPKRTEQNFLQKLKKSKQIQSYSCALKDGFMLYTGKITLYPEYLRFHSSFNPNTFFGSTDIFVPKFDIYQIIKGRHIMSLLINFVTKRGSLEFTSFFTDPSEVLLEVYMANRNTQYQNLSCQNFADNDNNSQLQELKQKMKSQFIRIAQKQNFQIKKFNVKDYEGSFQVQYIYFDTSANTKKSIDSEAKVLPQMFFRVNIKHYENSLQYVFWHSQNQTLNRKKQLQTIAKNVINEDRVQKFDNIVRQGLQRQKFENNLDDGISFNIIDQVSIIGRKQKHNLDFGSIGLNAGTPKSQTSLKNKNNLQKSEMYKFVENSDMKNVTSILSPKGALGQWVQNKQIKTKTNLPQKILDQLNKSGNIDQHDLRNVNGYINEINNLQLNSNNLNKSFENQLNKTNSINNKRSEGSRIVSPNASTVKYGQKSMMNRSFINKKHHQEQTAKIIKVQSHNQEMRSEGIKNILILIIIALGLISILKIFT